MLDLNVASPQDSSSCGGEAHLAESGTSNSSVLNAEASSNTGDEYKARVDEEVEENMGEDGISEELGFVTRQLFPLAQDCLQTPAVVPAPAPAASSSSSSRPRWVDTGFDQLGASALAETKMPQQQQQVKKSRRGPRSRSSQYRGVTFYRRTGRWESHIWDCGKQVYLGGFDTAHAAARAYDRAAIKFRGVDADINFNLSDYKEDLKQIRNLSKEEFVHILRRQSTGFSRGSSKYRGVTLHKCGRWEARMGQFLGKKKKMDGMDSITKKLMLGSRAYDKAAIKYNGREAVTNFEPSTYEGEILPEHSNEVSEDTLDLNLSISQPTTHCSKEDDNPFDIQLVCGSSEASNVRNVRIGNSTLHLPMHPHGLATAPMHPHAWTGFYPYFFSNTEERVQEKRPHVGAPVLPSPAWQAQGSVLLQPFSSAASSGFSATPSATALPSASPSLLLAPPTAHGLRLPPSSTNHYYFSG